MSILTKKLEKIEREELISDITKAKIKEQNVEITLQTLLVTPCKTFTQSILVHSPHGMIKKIITTPYDPTDSSPF